MTCEDVQKLVLVYACFLTPHTIYLCLPVCCLSTPLHLSSDKPGYSRTCNILNHNKEHRKNKGPDFSLAQEKTGTCVGSWHSSNPMGLCPRAFHSGGDKNPYFNNYILNHIPSRIAYEQRNKAWLHMQQLATSHRNLIQSRPTLCDNRASVPQTSVDVHNF